MKLYPYTWVIVSISGIMFGSYGLLSVLRIPFRTWEHWLVNFGGMLFSGLLFGFAGALLAGCLWYLYLRLSRSDQRKIAQPPPLIT